MCIFIFARQTLFVVHYLLFTFAMETVLILKNVLVALYQQWCVCLLYVTEQVCCSWWSCCAVWLNLWSAEWQGISYYYKSIRRRHSQVVLQCWWHSARWRAACWHRVNRQGLHRSPLSNVYSAAVCVLYILAARFFCIWWHTVWNPMPDSQVIRTGRLCFVARSCERWLTRVL